MAIHNLKDNHELVYIVPRSWTSGAYFERFRKYLFDHCVITNIHVFGSRDKIFEIIRSLMPLLLAIFFLY